MTSDISNHLTRAIRVHHNGDRSHHNGDRSHQNGDRSHHNGDRSHHSGDRSHHNGDLCAYEDNYSLVLEVKSESTAVKQSIK